MATTKKPNNFDGSDKSTKTTTLPSNGQGKTVKGDALPKQTDPNYSIPDNVNTENSSLDVAKKLAGDEHSEDINPPESVEGTKNAQGQYPYQDRVAAKRKVKTILGKDAGIVEGSSLTRDSVGPAPHYFAETNYQVFYHEVRMFIQGAEVSNWLEGSITIKYNLGSDPNTCDFTLNNAGNRFVLTPENLTGKFRNFEYNSLDADYDESAKAEIWEFKRNPQYNQPDTVSGGLIWPLSHWGLIFHKYDPIRVWIRNPAPREVEGKLADEWLPVFTGYLTSFPKRENFINGASSLTMHAEDIRTIIKNMRVNSNTFNYATPGAEINEPSTAPAPGVTNPNFLRYGENNNIQFDSSFFTDLFVNSKNNDDPWSDLTFVDIVEALTFNQDAQAFINGARTRRFRELSQQIVELNKQLQLTNDTNEQEKLKTQIEETKQQININYPSPEADGNTEANTYGKSNLPNTPSTTGVADRSQNKSNPKSSRIGRMQRGFFRGTENVSVIYPSAEDREGQIDYMEQWYSLCAFGSTTRDSQDYLIYDLGKLRYWTSLEVTNIGKNTRTTFSWAPDAQAIHMIEPGTSTTALPLFEVKILEGSNVDGTSRGFITRLEILSKACDLVDYRFWVTGTGDLVFEFPQYDFSPADYGLWENVLNFNDHVLEEDLNEEDREIKNVLVATGTITGHGNATIDANAKNYIVSDRVVVWIPTLVARLGVHKTDVVYNRVTNRDRLLQLAYIALQKEMGTFTSYSMTTCYRPWVQPNRPIFNKYRSKYALVENSSFVIPVTAGDKAGHNPPTSSLSLNYVRSIDVYGIPRYVTGGPSMPIFYGEKKSSTLISSLNQSVNSLRAFFSQIERSVVELTPDALKELRDIYGSFLPSGQDVYNVIGSSATVNQVAATTPNQIEELNRTALAVRNTLNELQNIVNDGRSKKEINKAIKEAQEAVEKLAEIFKGINVDYKPVESSAGLLPAEGISGFRSNTYIEPKDRPFTRAEPETTGNTCNLDRYQFSSPLGKAGGDLRLNNQIIQTSGTFPRTILTTFDQKPLTFAPGIKNFSGVDFIGTTGENVYTVSDGEVLEITKSDEFGNIIKIGHDNGYITTYAPVNSILSKGDRVTRNDVIGTLQTSIRSNLLTGSSALHFQTGTGGSSEDVVGYITGKYKTYPLTQEDLKWAIRAAIGEESDPSRKNHEDRLSGINAVVSCMLTRFAYINDNNIELKGHPIFPNLTTLLIGRPPDGQGYSQPVSYFWRTAEPPDTKRGVKGNRTPEAIDRRKKTRDLGTSEGTPFPDNVYNLVHGLFTGSVSLNNGEGSIHFRDRNQVQVNKFISDNAKLGCRIDNQIVDARNTFFSFAGSRKYKSDGYPKIKPNIPSGTTFLAYDPTNSGEGIKPGVPNKIYSINQNTKNSVQSWENNKVLIIGSLASSGIGPELKQQLIVRKATVETFPQVGGLPGGVSTRSITSTANMKLFKQKLKSFKPDVVFIVYGASNLTNSELQNGMSEIKETILAEGSDIWWVGPPTYDASLDESQFRPVFEQEGPTIFGNRYISSTSLTNPTNNRTSDKLNVTPIGAIIWSKGILDTAHGRNKGNTNNKPSTSLVGGGWEGAIPPEDCPPMKQARFKFNEVTQPGSVPSAQRKPGQEEREVDSGRIIDLSQVTIKKA